MKKVLILAGALMVLSIPVVANAQGIVGGARDGSREGGRIAGPVGGVVGGVVGAGVGGAVGGVRGVLGVPDRGYRRPYKRSRYYRRGYRSY